LLKSIFLKSSINERITKYLELKNISKTKLEKVINSSNETKHRKEILTTFISNSFDKDKDIDLVSGISKKDFENSFAVLN